MIASASWGMDHLRHPHNKQLKANHHIALLQAQGHTVLHPHSPDLVQHNAALAEGYEVNAHPPPVLPACPNEEGQQLWQRLQRPGLIAQGLPAQRTAVQEVVVASAACLTP